MNAFIEVEFQWYDKTDGFISFVNKMTPEELSCLREGQTIKLHIGEVVIKYITIELKTYNSGQANITYAIVNCR